MFLKIYNSVSNPAVGRICVSTWSIATLILFLTTGYSLLVNNWTPAIEVIVAASLATISISLFFTIPFLTTIEFIFLNKYLYLAPLITLSIFSFYTSYTIVITDDWSQYINAFLLAIFIIYLCNLINGLNEGILLVPLPFISKHPFLVTGKLAKTLATIQLIPLIPLISCACIFLVISIALETV